MNRELGLGRFTDTYRLGLLADIAFYKKFRVLGFEKPKAEKGAVGWLSQGALSVVLGAPGGLDGLDIITKGSKDSSRAFQ